MMVIEIMSCELDDGGDAIIIVVIPAPLVIPHCLCLAHVIAVVGLVNSCYYFSGTDVIMVATVDALASLLVMIVLHYS